MDHKDTEGAGGSIGCVKLFAQAVKGKESMQLHCSLSGSYVRITSCSVLSIGNQFSKAKVSRAFPASGIIIRLPFLGGLNYSLQARQS